MEEMYKPNRWIERDKFHLLSRVFDYKCVKCGRGGELHADHIVPYSLGGSGEIDNIQPLCQHCNSVKSNRENVDYRKTFFSRFEMDKSLKFSARINFLISVFANYDFEYLVYEITGGWGLDEEQKHMIFHLLKE